MPEGSGLSPLARVNRQREEPDVQWKAAAFARWHEPDDARASSPVLRGARGEIPRAYSAWAAVPQFPQTVGLPFDSGRVDASQRTRRSGRALDRAGLLLHRLHLVHYANYR